MTWQAWLTAGTLITMLGTLASGRLSADIALLGAVGLLLLAGIITPADAVAGFANPGVATIALLYVVTVGLRETGAMSMASARLLGRPRTALQAQSRLIASVTLLSAFTNNTTLVAAFLPVLHTIARRARIAASLLFMPLSFAAILGGVCTLIGTSTNLTVAALVQQHNRQHPDRLIPELGMFTFTPVGVCVAIAGVLYMLSLGRRLLPNRPEPFETARDARQYMTAMRVLPGSPMIGQTVESAGLRQLPGLFLSRIDRAMETVTAVGPEERITENDSLIFVGVLESVVDLQKTRGLVPVTDEGQPGVDRPSMNLVEAVVSPMSPLIGQSIRDAGIRTRYGAVVVAVHRHGHRLAGKIGDIEVEPGDTLLLETGPGFARRHRDSSEFHLVSELEDAAAPRHDRAGFALVVLLGVVILLSTEVIDPLSGALLGAALMLAGRCCTPDQARRGIDWTVLLVVGGSVALGKAMDRTGLAGTLAEHLLASREALGPIGLLAAVYLLTLVFTILMSNNAAAALMFPVALAAADLGGIPVMPLIACLTIAASAEFITPLGYQTNLMVAGPGGYRWSDFARFGGPLTLLCAFVCVAASAMWFDVPW
ncbi:MAG: SLC13 family permease [Phycisphaerae bacterium]|nr:SLC13 family permease [Phycisphaerae bacterium]